MKQFQWSLGLDTWSSLILINTNEVISKTNTTTYYVSEIMKFMYLKWSRELSRNVQWKGGFFHKGTK